MTQWSFLAALTALMCLPHFARAQGQITIVQTGQGVTLVTAWLPLTVPDGPGAVLSFDVGFSTDELFGPDAFLDAATAALSNSDSALFLPLVTMDASGALWAPGGEGTIPLPIWAIDRQIISPPDGAPVLAHNSAWRLAVEIPWQFLESEVSLVIDLFDNNDEAHSAAWITGIRIQPIPEPRLGLLSLVVVAGLHLFRRRAG